MESKNSIHMVVILLKNVQTNITTKFHIYLPFPILFSLLLGGVTIYWHWEAMLISYLATRVTPLPFRDLRGLYKSDYSLFVYPGSAVWDTFRYGSQLRQDIFKAKLEPYEEEYVTYKDRPSQIARLMQDTKNAMFSEYYTLAVFDEYIDCKFIQIPGKYDPKDYAIAYQQNSVYAELLDYWINRLIEIGVLDSLKTAYRKDGQECPSLRWLHTYSFSVKNVYS